MSINTPPRTPLEGMTGVSLELAVAASFERGCDETTDGTASRFVRLNRSEAFLSRDSVRAAAVARRHIVYPKAR